MPPSRNEPWFKRSRHGRHCTIASATAGTYTANIGSLQTTCEHVTSKYGELKDAVEARLQRMESRMDMSETRVDKLEEVGRGGGTRHHQHRLTDLNLDHIHRQDDRRIEVIANGLPIWGGAQLAVDTAIVSPLTRDGEPRQYAGTALTEARRRKERTYPELMRNRRCRFVVLGIETGGRWSEEAASFVKLLAHAEARQAPRLLLQHSVASPSSTDGLPCWPMLRCKPLPQASSTRTAPILPVLKGMILFGANSWPKPQPHPPEPSRLPAPR